MLGRRRGVRDACSALGARDAVLGRRRRRAPGPENVRGANLSVNPQHKGAIMAPSSSDSGISGGCVLAFLSFVNMWNYIVRPRLHATTAALVGSRTPTVPHCLLCVTGPHDYLWSPNPVWRVRVGDAARATRAADILA